MDYGDLVILYVKDNHQLNLIDDGATVDCRWYFFIGDLINDDYS